MSSGVPHGGDRIRLSGDCARSPRRSFESRLFLRFPPLGRAAFRLWSGLRPGSRLRRLLLVRFICQGMAAANRRDFDVLLLGLDPEIDYRAFSAGPAGAIVPDLVGHHHGHAGYLHVWRTMLEGFDDFAIAPEELLDLGERVISSTRLTGHGSGSGAPIDRLLFQVFTFRRGLVIRQEDFGELGEALAAAGAPRTIDATSPAG